MTMTREELQRLYDDCQDGRYGHLVALVDGVRRFLGEPDPTVEIAYLKAKVADLSDEYHTRWTQGRRPPMSHDDIKAALESRSDLPWRPSHDGPVATRPSDTYDVLDNDGETVAASLFYLDAHLIANAPTWLAELLAESERLTARAEAAERAIQRVRELHHSTPLTGTWGDCANGDCTHEDSCPEETRDVCAHCVDIFGELECVRIAIPCETRRALDGGEQR